MLKRILNRRGAQGFEPIVLKSLTRHPVDKKWYEAADATRLSNFDFVRDVFSKIEKQDPVAFFSLYSNHFVEYTELWGKPDFTYKSEYSWKGWVIDLSRTEQLILLSAKGGGSSFEVSGPGCTQWPPTLSDEAREKLCRIILTINQEIAGPKRMRCQEKIKGRSLDTDEPQM